MVEIYHFTASHFGSNIATSCPMAQMYHSAEVPRLPYQNLSDETIAFDRKCRKKAVVEQDLQSACNIAAVPKKDAKHIAVSE